METYACGHPIRDPRVLRRIEKAKSSQRLRDTEEEFHDPIEDNPPRPAIIRVVDRRTERESLIQGMGCSRLPDRLVAQRFHELRQAGGGATADEILDHC